MLLVRPKPYSDESLESYFLRLGQANGFDKHADFISALNHHLSKHNVSRPISLPHKLHALNLCFAHRSSQKRLKCLQLISLMTDQKPLPVLSLAIYRAGRKFSSGLGSVIRQGKLYPRQYLQQSHVGICPKCLAEAPYIRQLWHFEPYTCCHVHEQPLIHHCSCGGLIDYLANNSMAQCPDCGMNYGDLAPVPQKAIYDGVLLSTWFAGEWVESFPDVDTAHRWGLYLWWNQVSDNFPEALNFIELLQQWPSPFDAYLHQCLVRATEYGAMSVVDMKFSDVFGHLLVSASKLPSSQLIDNLVMCHVHQFLHAELMRPDSWLGGVRVNAIEAAILLGVPIEQIAALVEQSELSTCIRLKSDYIVQPNQSIFKLGDLFLLWLARFQVEGSNYHVITSVW